MRPRSDEEWDDHLREHPEATIYHTRLWARILAAAFPRLRDESRWIEAGGARAALPLHAWVRAGGLFTTRQSSFPFLYGGPVPRRHGGTDLLRPALEAIARTGGSFQVLTSPFATARTGDSASSVPPGVTLERETTHILTLPAGAEEFWNRTLTASKRNDVRRLTKKGVRVRRGGSEEEIAAIHRFYRQSFARWGARPGFVYPLGLYRAILRLGGEAARLYLAEYDGRLLGGAIVLRWNRLVHYHAGYYDREARAMRPNVLLQERIIREAIEEGMSAYDFLPSGAHPGVEEFKESFGGVRTSVPRYVRRFGAHRLLRRLRGAPGGAAGLLLG